MACRYIYKGHEFSSEIAFDDFLIENQKFESILGDIVFSQSSKKNTVESILNTISKDAKQMEQVYKEWRKQNKIKYGENGEESFDNPPYIGVNKFLSGYTNEDGELLFPEFREDEYWNRRFIAWKNGEYTETELEEFNIDSQNPSKILDSKQHESMRKQMENRWEKQGKTGTAIHNILQIIFTKNDQGKYNFELSDEELIAEIDKKLESKNKQFLIGNVIAETISYARTLHKNLIQEFGENLSFYPEFAITQKTTKVNSNNNPIQLFGIIDLLIVDGNGRVHILDYKTSVHSYSDFGSAKKSAYNYQMATYQRMLETYGISTYQSKFMVSPIQLKNFKRSGDTYIYDGIEAVDSFVIISSALKSQKLWDNINDFMPEPFKISLSAQNVGETVATVMAKCFPNYSSTKLIEEKQVIEMLKKNKQLTPDENGIYTFNTYGNEAPITASSESDFVQKVTKYLQGLLPKRLRVTGEVKNALESAIKEKSIKNIDFPKPSDARLSRDSDTNWLSSTLSKYCDGNWEIVNNEITESYGIIMLKTKSIPGIPNQVDFVRVSTNDLNIDYRHYFEGNKNIQNRKGLTSNFESDVQALSKSGSLMAKAAQGNVELMETMFIINQLSGLEKSVIGNISVVNPAYADGVQMSNEQLLYCFNELTKHIDLPDNKVLSGEIKFAKKYELVIQQLNRIVIAGENNQWRDEYRYLNGFKSCIPNYDSVINGNSEDQIKELLKLLKQMKAHDKLMDQVSGTYEKQETLSKIPNSLYNNIHIAIAHLKGINFRQQLEDHDKWLESAMIHINGVSGSYLDNPGNLNSETLNLITKLVTEAYQNTRDDMQREKTKISQLVEAVKKDAGFGYLQESTIGNQVDLYKDLYEYTADGNFLFKNPNRLPQGAKRQLLEYALEEINKRRFPLTSLEERNAMRDRNDVKYYEVPLALGGSDSTLSTQGLMSMFKSKLSYLYPKIAWEKAQKKVQGIYGELYESDERSKEKTQYLYKMQNMFDAGQKDNRIEKIKQEGIQNLEHNLETLLMKYIFAYSVQQNMDEVFPLIKSAMIHITTEGAMRNKPFKNDIEYFEEYLKNKVHNKSIVNEKNLKWVRLANMLKSAASKMTLAFAPVQMFYQPLQGLWQDISLMIRKPDGKDSFTFQHFVKATKLVYGDLFHTSNKPTLCQLINETYGINDMDMNSYVDRISSAKKGIWNFDNLLFKFASRPDFYNRMTIFTSQMMGDQCLEAHSVDSEGRLIYNWELDGRFSAFAKGDKSDIKKYNAQKQLYYAVAKQFVNEHAKNPDGTLFELNMDNRKPLPRAYTNKQAESMKSLSDDIYGYYSHEKKSLIMSTALGSLWLQFKTFWSGKKNQYLGSAGVKLRGDWKHYTENGKDYYYYQVDKDGNILYDKPPTTTETIAPVYQWDGQWQEGIMLTISDMVKSMWDQKSIIAGYKSKWNETDPKLRAAYRSNIRQLSYDLIMFAIVGSFIGALLGDWLDELKKDNAKNRDFMTGLGIAAANVAVMSVKNSFLDLNFIESIGSPLGQWTPFSVEHTGRTLSTWWEVCTGDEDFQDGVVKTFGGLKQIKPALDAIKPDMWRTKREGGTFNVEE